VGGDPQLVYNSETVDVRPIIEATLGRDADDHRKIEAVTATLTWAGGEPESPVTFHPTGTKPGDALLLAVQAAAPVTRTGVYGWRLDVNVWFEDGEELDREATGLARVVVRDRDNPFGAGWWLSTLDSLYVVDGGVLMVYGSGDSRFFQETAPGVY